MSYLIVTFVVVVTYMILDNVCAKYKNPSVLDIKMGRVRTDPEATQEKITRERLKCPYAEKLGFQLSGMMVMFAV